MKRMIMGALLVTSSLQPALAEDLKIGAAMMNYQAPFQTKLRNAIEAAAAAQGGIEVQFEDGNFDGTQQMNQVLNMVTSVKALIVSPVDASGTEPITKAAQDANIPLVYVNNRPAEKLPAKNVAVVASDESEAGELQMKEVCRLLGGKGEVLIIMGGLSFEQTRLRTGANEKVLESPECSGIKVIDKQAGDWGRTSGLDLMTNWLTSGLKPNAVLANNDDMALGALQALKSAGVPLGTGEGAVLVAGIDAIDEAVLAVEKGEMAATVFQDAEAQGKGAFEAVLKLSKGEPVESEIMVPFKLVNKDNVKDYLPK